MKNTYTIQIETTEDDYSLQVSEAPKDNFNSNDFIVLAALQALIKALDLE